MIEVGAVADLHEGVPVLVTIDRREVVLIRRENVVFALRNVCPHESSSFEAGYVHNQIMGGAEFGDLDVSDDVAVLSCPWHGWEFRLSDGQCTVDPSLRVKSYPTAIRDGRLFVEMSALSSDATTS
jgi:nitrite reductase (NADH) small subunit